MVKLEDPDFKDLEEFLLQQNIPLLTSRDYRGRSLMLTADNLPNVPDQSICEEDDVHSHSLRVVDTYNNLNYRENQWLGS